MLQITLPDGSQREFPGPVTVAEVAASIGAGLAKAALGGKVDGQLVDTSFRIERDARLAIVTGKNGGLHHFAWWLDDWDHVRRSADILAYNGIQIDVGPTRHGITRGNTIYFFDPLGTRNEVFTGGYRPDPDFPTITWTEDNIGRAVFYYEGELNDRFMKVHT